MIAGERAATGVGPSLHSPVAPCALLCPGLSWGPPSDKFTMPNGNTMYTWLQVGGERITANYNQYSQAVEARSVRYWCKTTFTTDTRGVIQTWRYEGNACRSR